MKKFAIGFFFISILLNTSQVYTETLVEESARRLPPVLNKLSSENYISGRPVNIEWSIIAYQKYKSGVAFFYDSGSSFEYSGLLTHLSEKQGTWSYKGHYSTILNYKYNFTPPTVSEPTDIILRFYRLGCVDETDGKSGLSLLIPGAITDKYYDTSGRRIIKTIMPDIPDYKIEYNSSNSSLNEESGFFTIKRQRISFTPSVVEYQITINAIGNNIICPFITVVYSKDERIIPVLSSVLLKPITKNIFYQPITPVASDFVEGAEAAVMLLAGMVPTVGEIVDMGNFFEGFSKRFKALCASTVNFQPSEQLNNRLHNTDDYQKYTLSVGDKVRAKGFEHTKVDKIRFTFRITEIDSYPIIYAQWSKEDVGVFGVEDISTVEILTPYNPPYTVIRTTANDINPTVLGKN